VANLTLALGPEFGSSYDRVEHPTNTIAVGIMRKNCRVFMTTFFNKSLFNMMCKSTIIQIIKNKIPDYVHLVLWLFIPHYWGRYIDEWEIRPVLPRSLLMPRSARLFSMLYRVTAIWMFYVA
jgi:hypothetical protein